MSESFLSYLSNGTVPLPMTITVRDAANTIVTAGKLLSCLLYSGLLPAVLLLLTAQHSYTYSISKAVQLAMSTDPKQAASANANEWQRKSLVYLCQKALQICIGL